MSIGEGKTDKCKHMAFFCSARRITQAPNGIGAAAGMAHGISPVFRRRAADDRLVAVPGGDELDCTSPSQVDAIGYTSA